jgi:hypothetical protein
MLSCTHHPVIYAYYLPTTWKINTGAQKEPAEGIEPSIYRLRSGCLATWPYRRSVRTLPGALPKIRLSMSTQGED